MNELTLNSNWIDVNDKSPICYRYGDWDGARSDKVLIKRKSGDIEFGELYEGILDGEEFKDWYLISGFHIPLIKGDVIQWMYIPQ